MAEEIQAAIAMERFRCHQCHRWFLVELGSPHPCPACLASERDALKAQLRDVRFERDEAYEKHCRQVSALKGAITKAKRK